MNAKLEGRVRSINVSDGGVPKRAVPQAAITRDGVEGDRQRHTEFHGGPERAVSVLGLDVIRRLQDEGHPIGAGTTGENLTLEGVSWADVVPGCRLTFEHGVELEVLAHARPCSTIKASFLGGDITRVCHEQAPGSSRLYTRVLAEGTVRTGESFRVALPVSG